MIPLDWNRERYRTRDRLLEYDYSIYPQVPHTAGLAVVYPWENIATANLMRQLYKSAADSGFIGTEDEFLNNFGKMLQNKQIIFGTIDTFEPQDDNTILYYDIDDNILYYYNEEFIPINALLIENTIINGGNAPQEDEVNENG